MSYLSFIALQASAAAVITDSGGVQEESTYLDVPCFTLRDNTERPVTVRLGTNTVLGKDPARIAEIPDLLANPKSRAADIPGWDGRAAQRIAEALT